MNIDEFSFFSLARQNNLGEWFLNKKYSIDCREIEFKIICSQNDVFVYTILCPTTTTGLICLSQKFMRKSGALIYGAWYGISPEISLYTIYEEIAQDVLREGNLLLAMGREIIKSYGRIS